MSKNTPQPRAILIGRTDGILREICKPLVEAGFHVTVFAPLTDQVWRARDVPELHEIPDLEVEELVNFVRNDLRILESEGWFFWSSNELARGILHSNIPDITKSKLLNGIRLEEASIIGSRVNQVELFQKLNLPIPNSFAIRSSRDLKHLPTNLPMLVKSDFGGRGEGILDYSLDEDENAIGETQYPFVVQEKLLGDTLHVEIFFEKGQLVYWALSKETSKITDYGYCPIREYSSPTSVNFLESITRLGSHLQISGPVGAAFIQDRSDDVDKLIEFDLNCGVWHHSFAFLEFPLSERLSDVRLGRHFLPGDATVHLRSPLRLYDRHEILKFARSNQRIYLGAASLLGRKSGRLGIPMPSMFSPTMILKKSISKWFFRLTNIR